MELKPHYKNTSLENIEGEIWVDALGLDGYYEVSSFGRIKSLGRYVNCKGGQRWKKEIIRKQFISSSGSLSSRLNVNGQVIDTSIQRLIYFSFNLKENVKGRDWVVMHKNKDKTDNRIENLVYTTCSESNAVNFKMGLSGDHLIKGQRSHRKFTKENSLFDSNGKTTHRMCKKCKTLLLQDKFDRYGLNTCRKCRYQEWKVREQKKKNSR